MGTPPVSISPPAPNGWPGPLPEPGPAPGPGFTFRTLAGFANLTVEIWSFKKTLTRPPLPRSRVPYLLAVAALLQPVGARSQAIFDWPIRATPQPEAVLTGAGAAFWNPGGLAAGVGTLQEVWVTHMVGPSATGIQGVAAAGVMDLPLGFRGALGYWHLGIRDIPRTTTSPNREPGGIHVAEDIALLALAHDLRAGSGLGVGLRLQQGSVGRDTKTFVEGEIGVHHRSRLPLTPRVGLTLQGVGRDLRTLAGIELSLPALAASRLPLRAGYGIQAGRGSEPLEHRVSLRASWMEQVHAGIGLSYLGEGGGWTPMVGLGADLGRYSLSVLREALANGFGAAHFYRAAIRFP